MIPPGFLKYYTIVFTAALTVFAAGNQGEDVCSSSRGFCGGAKCSPVNDTFSCDCGALYYFNATSKRCFHRASCKIIPCHHSICADDDGRSEAKCTCEGLPHWTTNCEVDPAFQKQCDANGGTMRIAIKDGRSVPKCTCPVGTKQLASGMCKSIACLLPNLTCEQICSNEKLREDQRCCQNWNKDQCNRRPELHSYCEPGTIWNDGNNSCTNACAASQAGPVCEHGCTYADPIAPVYQCKCQDGEVLSSGGLYCKVKAECSDDDVDACATDGRLCVVEDGNVQCKCPENTIEDAGKCSDTCSSEKAHECASFLSSCTLKENVETCYCHPPLRWNAESKQCVLDEQYKYVVFFNTQNSHGLFKTREQCTDHTQEEIINSSMKTLYGLQLQAARIVNCSSEITKIELTFNEDPPTAVLQRIRLCDNGTETCSFPPRLQIKKGSVSGPIAVDLCHTYFDTLEAVSNGTYRCSNLGHGRYRIHCFSAKSKKEISSGFLELHLCSDRDEEKRDSVATWDLKATIACISIAVLIFVCLVLILVLYFRRRYCFYRLPVDDTEYGPVKFQGKENLAEEPEPTVELLQKRYEADTPRRQNRANEAALVRT